MSVVSTIVVSILNLLLKSSFKRRYTAIYVTLEKIIWSPLLRSAKKRPERAVLRMGF